MNSWPSASVPRRKVFISYYAGDQREAAAFVEHWAQTEGVFIPKTVGITDTDDFINSNDSDYVMGRIWAQYLGDSTVTILLIGTCTHSRRYIDWEIKSSLRQGETYIPNGLIGVLLPSAGSSAHLPERFQANWNKGGNCYARYYYPPMSAGELVEWIEDAYAARTTRSHLITNSSDMLRYNRTCQKCGLTH